jgi:hypothetical protein
MLSTECPCTALPQVCTEAATNPNVLVALLQLALPADVLAALDVEALIKDMISTTSATTVLPPGEPPVLSPPPLAPITPVSGCAKTCELEPGFTDRLVCDDGGM